MPKFVVPRRSGAHRVAAIALYRALLVQCAAATALPAEQRDTLRTVVRNKFRRNRHVQSTRLLKLAFTAGYSALDLLDKCSSSSSSTSSAADVVPPSSSSNSANDNDDTTTPSPPTLIAALLASTPAHLRRPPRRDPPASDAFSTASELPPPRPEACLPPGSKILDVRPLPQHLLGGSGVRRVPKLVAANTYPLLRLGGANGQPRSVSRVITDKIKQKQRRLDTRSAAAGEWMEAARMEDEWDGIVARMHGVGEGEEGEEGGWTETPRAVVKLINERLSRGKRKTQEMVERMQALVDLETELAEREREERRARRKRVTSGQGGDDELD